MPRRYNSSGRDSSNDMRGQVMASLPRMDASPAPAVPGGTPRVTGLVPAPMVVSPAPTEINFGYSVPRTDVAAGLPTEAAARLTLLRERADDFRRRTPAFDEVQSLSLEKIAAQRALERLTSHPQFGGFNRDISDPLVITAQAALDKATLAYNQIRERQSQRTAGWQTCAVALRTVEDYLGGGVPGGTRFEVVDTPLPKLNKGESPLDGIERLRRRVRELRADAHRVASSQFPAEHCKRKMREQISRLATQNAPDVSVLVEHDRDVVFPTERLTSEVLGGANPQLGFAEIPHSTGLLCWLWGDEIARRLDEAIDSEMDLSSTPLGHTERAEKLAEIASDIEAIERQECELIFTAQKGGQAVELRGDANPLAILGLRLVAVVERDSRTVPSTVKSWPMP